MTHHSVSLGIKVLDLLKVVRDPNLILDLRYTTDTNFTGQKVFDREQVLLEPETAAGFLSAVSDFQKQGYKVVVWDAFRTVDDQNKLLEANSDPRYVASDSNHCKGKAIDMTLATKDGQYLDMGTDFDSFSEEAHADYDGLTDQQKANRQLLTQTMQQHGFVAHPYEWWHFDFLD